MPIFAVIQSIVRAVRRAARDATGAVSVEFVLAVPILVAVLVFTSEFGRLLQAQVVLDNAVGDAVRYLARAPLNAAGGFGQGAVDQANQLIISKITTPHYAIAPPNLGPVVLNNGTVSLTVAIGVELPALQLMQSMVLASPDGVEVKNKIQGIEISEIEGMIITATETAIHFGR